MSPKKPRRNEGDAHSANHERWLVSYADLVTLLFAFFVVMYAISQLDLAKLKKASGSMKEAFDVQQAPTAGVTGAVEGAGASTASESKSVPASEPPWQEEIRAALPEGSIEILSDERGWLLRIPVRDAYREGRIEPDSAFRGHILTIGRSLAATGHRVQVEGHADEFERPPEGVATSWELSTARAAWIVREWLQHVRFEPKKLSAVGLAHFHPDSARASQWGRAANRRVEIVVLAPPRSQ